MQAGLLPETVHLPMRPGYLHLWKQAWSGSDPLPALIADLDWRQDHIHLFGRRVAIPRLQCWYGEPHCHYRYSGLELQPQAFPPLLRALCRRAEELCGRPFNCCLCNLYRDGNDSMGWHADDEPELGPEPWVATWSFGRPRRFRLRFQTDTQRVFKLELEHASLLLMSPEIQSYWHHQLPRCRSAGPRVSLTFRYIEAR